MRITILRLPAVLARAGLSKSTLYSRVSDGLWPKPVNLGSRAVGWPSGEVEALISALIAGQPKEEIRSLVVNLEAKRKIASLSST